MKINCPKEVDFYIRWPYTVKTIRQLERQKI